MENFIEREILEFYCCFQDKFNVSLLLMSKQSLALSSFLFNKDALKKKEIIFLSVSHLQETKRVTFSTKGHHQPMRPSNACVRIRKRGPSSKQCFICQHSRHSKGGRGYNSISSFPFGVVPLHREHLDLPSLGAPMESVTQLMLWRHSELNGFGHWYFLRAQGNQGACWTKQDWYWT